MLSFSQYLSEARPVRPRPEVTLPAPTWKTPYDGEGKIHRIRYTNQNRRQNTWDLRNKYLPVIEKKDACWFLSRPTPDEFVKVYHHGLDRDAWDRETMRRKSGVAGQIWAATNRMRIALESGGAPIYIKPDEIMWLRAWFGGSWSFTDSSVMDSRVNAILKLAACPSRAPWTYDTTGNTLWRGVRRKREEVLKYRFTPKLRRFADPTGKLSSLWVEVDGGKYLSRLGVQSWSSSLVAGYNYATSKGFARGEQKDVASTFGVLLEAKIPKEQTFLSAEIGKKLGNWGGEDETIRVSNSPLPVTMYLNINRLADHYLKVPEGAGKMRDHAEARRFAVSVFGADVGAKVMANPEFLKELLGVGA